MVWCSKMRFLPPFSEPCCCNVGPVKSRAVDSAAWAAGSRLWWAALAATLGSVTPGRCSMGVFGIIMKGMAHCCKQLISAEMGYDWAVKSLLILSAAAANAGVYLWLPGTAHTGSDGDFHSWIAWHIWLVLKYRAVYILEKVLDFRLGFFSEVCSI